MPTTPPSLEQNLESVSKIVTAASKLGVLVGGACVIGYSLKIDHFPQDLSVGDGLLFLMAATCFGVIYVFFIASLVALGITTSPAMRVAFKFVSWIVTLLSKRKVDPAHELEPFEWSSVLFALFSIIIILALGSKDSNAYWKLPLLSVVLYLFYSIYMSCGKKIRAIEQITNSALHTKEKGTVARIGDVTNLKKVQLFSLATILLIPLVLGGVSGQLLDAAMRAAHVRIENSIIYVKEPYSSLLPKSVEATNLNTPKNYTAFDKTAVLFTGFGKTTVISFQDGSAKKKLEIPTDHIIVVNR